MKKKLIQEIDLLPEVSMAEVYHFVHFFRLGIEKQSKEGSELSAFSDSWSGMNDGHPDDHFPSEEMSHSDRDLRSEILEIGKYCSSLPRLDDRRPDDILGYDERGMPR